MESLRRSFTIYDDSNYEPGKSSDSGNYGYWQTYNHIPASEATAEHYVRHFYTTHKFGICRDCGALCQSPQDYDLHESCDPKISVFEALSALLAALDRVDEKAKHFDGPAIQVAVEYDRI